MTQITTIHWEKTLLLIDASILAYQAFDKPASLPARLDGYEIVDTWTGVDAFFGKVRKTETYGVVLRSSTAPYRYVFAFRGTDSFFDVLDDLGSAKGSFRPTRTGIAIPDAVEVEDGFNDIYKDGIDGKPSMQQQLFSLVDRYQQSDQPIEELWITGHSLGSALSALFSLDLALSRPEIRASNLNFACPRVGNDAFVSFYEQQAAEKDPERRTIRVHNVYDIVPCLPPEALRFGHVGDSFLVAFHKHGWLPDLKFALHNHSSTNYRAVLECAARSPDSVCLNKAMSVAGIDYELTSVTPDPAKVCNFL